MLKVHSILRAALGQAVCWQMITDNPAIHASPPRPARPRVRAPRPDDVARLLAAAQAEDPEFTLYLRLAAVTGARRGELCALRWDDFDLEGGQVVMARSLTVGDKGVLEKRTKTDRVRRLALDDATVTALRAQERVAGERARACDVEVSPKASLAARCSVCLVVGRDEGVRLDRGVAFAGRGSCRRAGTKLTLSPWFLNAQTWRSTCCQPPGLVSALVHAILISNGVVMASLTRCPRGCGARHR